MSLKKEYVRDGKGQILGTVTSGFGDKSAVVRDGSGSIRGRTSDLYHTTRDERGKVVSKNTADPGLLIPKK